ncbi:MAG: tRNA-dihydrouridine synthase [Patescibacteria group bacterium]
MNRGFWDKLEKPIFALAPMANVTDAAFRRIIAKYGKPDVMWTEFVSADGLCSAGREKLLIDLEYSEAERPIVAQIFGAHPERIEEAAALVARLGFDGLDINMGCPDRAVEKQGAGAALMKNPKLAQEVIRAAKRGAPQLPISVKTRIGYKKNELAEWLPALIETELAAIIIHARTRAEMSKVPAHWEAVREAVEIARSVPAERRPLILGNGDVETLSQAEERVKETGADGVMIGRGIFGNPWFFSRDSNDSRGSRGSMTPTTEEKLAVMLEHTRAFEEFYGPSTRLRASPEAYARRFCGGSKKPYFALRASKGNDTPVKKTGGRWIKGFSVMKKHYKAYVNGFPGASALRAKLMLAKDPDEVEEIVRAEYPNR